ncbi:MAG: Antitoxin HigA1 [Syntrophomonadaceae bacterium]|nr:Antitoxin HigA1 [Bacillota bacterium]
MKLKDYLEKQLKDPEFRKEYEALEPEYQLAKSIIELRLKRGITQKELAERIGTKQSGISRLESVNTRSNPSLSLLERVAEALDAKLVVYVKPRENLSGGTKI